MDISKHVKTIFYRVNFSDLYIIYIFIKKKRKGECERKRLCEMIGRTIRWERCATWRVRCRRRMSEWAVNQEDCTVQLLVIIRDRLETDKVKENKNIRSTVFRTFRRLSLAPWHTVAHRHMHTWHSWKCVCVCVLLGTHTHAHRGWGVFFFTGHSAHTLCTHN